MEAIIVMTSLPDQASAQRIAQALVEARLAACVNILAPCISTYHWRGKIETAQEVPLLIKTLQQHYSKVEETIRACHPYELPEVVAVTISSGLPAYLDWIATDTSPHS